MNSKTSKVIFLLSTLWSSHIYASPNIFKTESSSSYDEACPMTRPEDFKALCSYICDKTKDKKNGTDVYPFHYQTYLFKMACTSRSEPEEMINRKVQNFWKKHEKFLNCNAVSFNMGSGDLIKYAVANYFDEFIFDVTTWGVELNRIDPADGKTVLDYVRDELHKERGTPLENTLKSYYYGLKEAGAKHRDEL